eukprot:12931292-Prorocentrum_lima.AAC.1
MVYVDEVIMFGSTSMAKKIIDAFRKPWNCRVAGIIPRDGSGGSHTCVPGNGGGVGRREVGAASKTLPGEQ